jgi:hypothetical protein
MFILCCAGMISTKPKDKIIYEQEQQINLLRTEIRDLKRAEPWLLLLHENIPEIRQIELDCAAEALKQKLWKEAKNEI